MTENLQFLFSSLQRLQRFPLDSTSVFPNEEALNEYLENNKTAYPGQIVAILEGTAQNELFIRHLDVYVLFELDGKMEKEKIGFDEDEIREMAIYEASILDVILEKKLQAQIDIINLRLADHDIKIANLEAKVSDIENKTIPDIYNKIKDVSTSLETEIQRSQLAEENILNKLSAEEQRAKEAEAKIQESLEETNAEVKRVDTKIDSTKTELLNVINAQNHFSSVVIESLDEIETKYNNDSTLLYLLESKDGKYYHQYLVIDGVATEIGTTETKLEGYVSDEEFEKVLIELNKKIEDVQGDVSREEFDDIVESVNNVKSTIDTFFNDETGKEGVIDTLNEITNKLEILEGSVNESKVTEIFKNLIAQMFREFTKPEVDDAIEENVETTDFKINSFTQVGQGDIENIISSDADSSMSTPINKLEQLSEEDIMKIISEGAMLN